jgi:Tfp pilus assembly protein PilX
MKHATRQKGASLIVSLIMLVVLTLLVVSAVRTSTSGLQILGNTQVQMEATAAAQQAIEQIVSTDFTLDAPAVALTPTLVDLNSDGATDYTVTSKATCLNADPIPMNELDVTKEDDKYCFQSSKQNFSGMIGGAGAMNSSVCNSTQWDVEAKVADPSSGTQVELHQGISKRVGINIEC